jgi:hypothetical protein
MQDDAQRFAALAASAYVEFEEKQKRLEAEYGNTIWRRAIVSSSRPLYREVGKIEAAS